MNPAAVVNPSAGAGAARRAWPGIARQLEELAVRFTEGPGHAAVLARELADAGFDPIIAAGGDGTLHEVVNGLLPGRAGVRVALIPLASGGDFSRTLGLSRVSDALRAIREGCVREVDVLRVRFETGERFAVNAASFGLGARVAEGARRWPRFLPGTLRYLAAAIPPLAAGEAFDIRISIDGAPPLEYRITTGALANGRYQGGGIHIAPEAAIDDGRMDVTIVEQVSLAEVCAHLPILYNGKLLTYKKVRHAKAVRVKVEGSARVPVEVDGELAGTLPLEAEIVPGALRLIARPN